MAKTIRDADLLDLCGTRIASPNYADVCYRIERVLGEGAQGVAFLAQQELSGASRSVVLKVLRPRVVRALDATAPIAISKEVGALRRLSERDPPTPFVVGYLDTGVLRLTDHALELPWIALEYVAGGPEGATLSVRVAGELARTATAFDLVRARRALRAIVSGIGAIHDVGVIHRDLNPGNVLCSGSGETECFKISDFGLARFSSASTYGDVLLGTPGYCAPEQSFPDKIEVGPYSDVFGLACTFYFVLTGEPYFQAPTIPETLVAVYDPHRPKLLEANGLCGELRARPALCAALDELLGRSTQADPRARPQSANEFGDVARELLATATHISR